MSKVPVITIDGLSGAGKGTVSKILCKELGWNILDSGALYRTLTYLMGSKGVGIEDFKNKKKELLNDFEVAFQIGTLGEPVSVFLKEEDITKIVRTEEIAEKTSTFSSLKEIRDFIRPCQRAFKQFPGLIADEGISGIFPRQHGRNCKPIRQSRFDVFHRVHSDINSAREQRFFKFL